MSETITVTPVAASNVDSTPKAAPQEAAVAPVETQPEVKAEPKELASVRFAALAKKEAKLQSEREALKKEREGLTPLQEQIKTFEEAKANAFKNPLKLLESLGLSIDQVNEYFLNGGEQTPDLKLSEVDRKIEAFRKEQQDKEDAHLKSEQSRIEAEAAKQVADFNQSVKDLIAQSADKYELTKLYSQEAEVFRVIEKHFEQTNEVMATETACELVEKYLEGLVDQAISTKKIKAKVQPPQPQTESKQAPKSTSNRTISSTLTPASLSKPSAQSQTLGSSDTDRLSRAVAKYHALAKI